MQSCPVLTERKATVDQNDGATTAQLVDPWRQCSDSHGTSGQREVFDEIGSQVPEKHRSPVVNSTWSGTVAS